MGKRGEKENIIENVANTSILDSCEQEIKKCRLPDITCPCSPSRLSLYPDKQMRWFTVWGWAFSYVRNHSAFPHVASGFLSPSRPSITVDLFFLPVTCEWEADTELQVYCTGFTF